jgi:hypothetical protein
MKRIEYEYEYVVSPRVTLRPGDKFRVKGGPFVKTDAGKIPLTPPRGAVYTVIRVQVYKSRKVIEAWDKGGCFAPLHVEGRRRSAFKEIVPRPYQVTSRLRSKGDPPPKKKKPAGNVADGGGDCSTIKGI